MKISNVTKPEKDYIKTYTYSDSIYYHSSYTDQSLTNTSLSSRETFMTLTHAKTDDVKFALNEINRINKKQNRLEYNSTRLADKHSKTIDTEQNKLRKRIKEYKNSKKLLEEENKIINIIKLDSFNKSFFNQEQLDSIKQTNKILKEKESSRKDAQDEIKKIKTKSMRGFLDEKQEITMKSYLIKIVEQERNVIAHKNLSMAISVRETENKLDEDLKLFEKFTEIEKKKKKERERVMNEQIKENKSYYDKKKELTQQNKMHLDEIDRVVKMINNEKEYRTFVHNIFGNGTEIDERDKQTKTRKSSVHETMRNEKDIEKIGEEVIHNYSHFVHEKKSKQITELLSDHNGMIKMFADLEAKILKSVEARQEMQEVNEKVEGNNYLNSHELEDKLLKLTKEMDSLKREKYIVEEQVRKLKINSTAMSNDKETVEVIKELYSMACGANVDPNKSVDELLKELLEYFKTREYQVINYIDDIEEIYVEDEENKLKKILEFRKEMNKNEKVIVARQKLEKGTHLRKNNAQERMNRIVVKGRKTVGKLNLEANNRKENRLATEKENDDGNLFLY